MKQPVFILMIVLMVSAKTMGQSKSDKMYNVLSGQDGVTNFSFSKNMTDALDIDLGDDNENRVTGDLNQVRFMSFNPKKGDLSGDEFIQKAIDYLPKPAYKKYEDREGEVDGAEIWLMGKGKNYSECHVFVQNKNEQGIRFVVSFFGDFKLEDIDGLKKAGKEFSDD